MFGFHKDKERYFDIQYSVTREYVLPFLRHVLPGKEFHRVLEIGCGEAGVLKCFLEEGAFCTGIELSPSRIASAEHYHEEAIADGRIEFINRNVLDIDPEIDLGGTYDLVILKDVIEHIPNQHTFIAQLSAFLNEDGVIFFGFPPWQMPYGGHQQICRSKWLSKWPWLHLLPTGLYRSILRWAGEPDFIVEELLEIKETGLSIERFERYIRINHLRIVAARHYLINPIYLYKFGLEPRLQSGIVRRIPWLKNFMTSGVYYVVK